MRQVRSIQDDKIPARYLEVASDDPAAGARIFEALQAGLDTFSLQALQRAVAASESAEAGPIMRLALGCQSNEFDETSHLLIVAGLASEDREVRLAAAMAMAITRWVEFAPPLIDALDAEEDGELIDVLAVALDVCTD